MKKAAFPSGKEEEGDSPPQPWLSPGIGVGIPLNAHDGAPVGCQAWAGHWRDSSAKTVLAELLAW